MASADYYKILGISRSASQEDLRKAYRDLARKYHPDVNKADDAASKFNQIQLAYDTLSDPEQRKAYDRFGAAGPRTSQPRGQSGVDFDIDDLDSVFETFFGRQGAGRPAGRARSGTARRGIREPIRHEISVPFMNAALGGSRQVRVVIGTQEKSLDINIPSATTDGTKLRVRKASGLDRDIILTIRVGEHPHFRRAEGKPLDLEFDLPVSIVEATLGAKIRVPTMDGHVELTLPAGTSSGQGLRLRGRGLSSTKGESGDLIGFVRIVPPKVGSMTDNDRRALEDMGERLGSPREGAAWADGWKP